MIELHLPDGNVVTGDTSLKTVIPTEHQENLLFMLHYEKGDETNVKVYLAQRFTEEMPYSKVVMYTKDTAQVDYSEFVMDKSDDV
jgi:hypothetical protein